MDEIDAIAGYTNLKFIVPETKLQKKWKEE